MKRPQLENQLTLYGQSFSSRLLLGTARYDSPSVLADAIFSRGSCDADRFSPAPDRVDRRTPVNHFGICSEQPNVQFSPILQAASAPMKR